MLNYIGFLYEKRDHRGKIKKFADVPEIIDWAHNLDPNMSLWIADKFVKDLRHFFNNVSKVKELYPYFEKFLQGEKIDEDHLKNVKKYLGDAKKALEPKFRKVLDYVNSPLHRNKPNINKLSLEKALEISEKWHKEIEQSSSKHLIEDEDGEIIMEFTDGYYWIDLQTTSCSDEAKAMGHCGNTGMGTTILSLRKYKQPHVTIAWDEDENIFTQIKGKGNDKPVEKYHPYIVDLICKLEIVRLKSEYQRTTDFDADDLNEELYKKLEECNPDYIENSRPLPLEEIERRFREDLEQESYTYDEYLEMWGGHHLWDFMDDERYLRDFIQYETEYYMDDFIDRYEGNEERVAKYIYEEFDEEILQDYLKTPEDKSHIEVLEEMEIVDLEKMLITYSEKENFIKWDLEGVYEDARDVYWNLYGDPDKVTLEDFKSYGFMDYVDSEKFIDWIIENEEEDRMREMYDE